MQTLVVLTDGKIAINSAICDSEEKIHQLTELASGVGEGKLHVVVVAVIEDGKIYPAADKLDG